MQKTFHYMLLISKYSIISLFIIFASLLIITNIIKFNIISFTVFGSITLGLFFLSYYFNKIIWSIESRPKTGAESLPGKEGIAITDIDKEGEVRVEGIIWHARSIDGRKINRGERVIVERIEGIWLIVKKV
ncbi:MAG: NfeD family protein [Thermoplasmata archaeon]|jgi:membrane-bound serine protease (ClpP class)|nr:hypothetical protein [Thermoplasmatales archaeon]PMP73191.1 MAG: hypothetical protein C0180_07475 [Aciduliprofundum sp.]HEU12972.1 hypothetical protein [Euryarchaeota archaeon]